VVIALLQNPKKARHVIQPRRAVPVKQMLSGVTLILFTIGVFP
jgi:hypothetical protein